MIVKELKIKYSQKTIKSEFDTSVGFSSPELVKEYTKHYFEGEIVESMLVLLLNRQTKIAGYHIASRGIISETLVHPREIFKPAILANASSIILVHNHPSGNNSPSANDDAVTRRIKEAGKLLGIDLLDHVIVTDDDFYSYREHGNL